MKNENRCEMFTVMLNISTRVITLIILISSIIDKSDWRKESIWGIMFMGAFSGLAYGLFYIKKNMTRIQTFIFYLLYIALLNVVLFIVGLRLGWIQKDLYSCAKLEIMFLLVFFGVYFLTYLFDFHEARKINQKLKDRKNQNQQ